MTQRELSRMIQITANKMSGCLERDELVSEMWLETLGIDVANCNKTYMFKTLKGICLNKIKKFQRHIGTQLVEQEADNNDLDSLIDNRQLVETLTRELSRREKDLLYHAYWTSKSNDEIGDMFCLSGKYISELLRNTLKKMRGIYYESI